MSAPTHRPLPSPTSRTTVCTTHNTPWGRRCAPMRLSACRPRWRARRFYKPRSRLLPRERNVATCIDLPRGR